ncbi:alanine racemase [Sphingobacterium alimentarium]|uniref:Alanine racemase n=1 Tax=Sphingobacterium alimentarium TaxID=797292 RepID=A0A4R3VXE0_9SPHI|nr:bifunctional UDP-N-acetylmuramoyl-tripeptide:D-alanyl-D-alanine ligase/alanine racemase [Sphingobacterium alimentarium]TCV09623.1 alanine racemase [Sphingobacterium alimentarium]
MYEITQIIDFLNPIQSHVVNPSSSIDSLAYDSRKLHAGQRGLFFALKGQQDGHKYVADAYRKGVRNFVLSDLNFNISAYTEANFIWVKDTVRALQHVAAMHRSHIHIPVVGITGSNGKTIVKEWLAQLLKADRKVYQSPKSYNSQIGVPISLWHMSNDYDIALIEAGISTVGEMTHLEQIIQPTWGIFTSFGTAHQEGFTSTTVKFEEKWQLFRQVEKIIAPSTHIPENVLGDERIIRWGTQDTAKLRIKNIEQLADSYHVQGCYQGILYSWKVPFTDKGSLENCLTCMLVLLELGYSMEVISERILLLRPLDMRLKLKKGKHNSSIIDDSYSNDLASLNIALDFLNQQNQFKYKKLVLSDFEGEEWTPRFEHKLQNLLMRIDLEELLLVGERFRDFTLSTDAKIQVFESTAALLASYNSLDFSDSVVLIKGARKYHLEELSKRLTQQSHETVMQINLKAIENNLRQYRSKLEPSTKLMAMVKAFSYGSGSFEIANILQFNNVDYLTVAFVDEGSELRRAGVKLPIMVLSPHESTFEDIILYNIEPEIYSIKILKAFIHFLKGKELSAYPIHIKLDTGMHRLGFCESEIDLLLDTLENQSQVKIQSVFSHLVGAGDTHFSSFTQEQIHLYQNMVHRIKSTIGYDFIRHICNTSGIVHHPEAHLDMVRLGIGLYGYDANSGMDLEEISVLKTTITQIKRLPQDETIGYDRKGVLQRDSVIATVKIGYADGYSRRFGNGVGKMLINGKQAPTIGNICMDMCMLDITGIEAQEGDEVVVFPDLLEAAHQIGTIPYELLTGISSRVKRIYYYE